VSVASANIYSIAVVADVAAVASAAAVTLTGAAVRSCTKLSWDVASCQSSCFSYFPCSLLTRAEHSLPGSAKPEVQSQMNSCDSATAGN